MKKSRKKSIQKTSTIDIETLKHSKKVSTRGKLNWLESALYFGKLKRFH